MIAILTHRHKLESLALISLAMSVALFVAPSFLTERSPSYAQVLSDVPIGSVTAWPGSAGTIPDNWRVCDGSEVSRGEFPRLFDAIGTNWGAGAGSNRFKLPDLRGLFLRGVDSTAGRDPDIDERTPSGTGDRASVGSTQQDQFRSHDHGGGDHSHTTGLFRGAATDFGGPVFRTEATASPGAVANSGRTINPAGGDETRPKNAYVFWIIKVR